MAGYGAYGFRWAPIVSDADPTKLPTYGPALSMGPLASVAETITMVTGENYGDDVLQDFIEEFQRLDLSVVSTDIPVTTAAAFLGIKPGEDGAMALNVDNEAPYGGAGFFARRGHKQADGTYKRYFRAVLYPYIKGKLSGVTATTKGSSISFANDTAQFTGTTCAKGDYRIQNDFDTAEAAKAWLDSMMPMANS